MLLASQIQQPHSASSESMTSRHRHTSCYPGPGVHLSPLLREQGRQFAEAIKTYSSNRNHLHVLA
eukprot:9199802-Karenia_brevis.AAC.1